MPEHQYKQWLANQLHTQTQGKAWNVKTVCSSHAGAYNQGVSAALSCMQLGELGYSRTHVRGMCF